MLCNVEASKVVVIASKLLLEPGKKSGAECELCLFLRDAFAARFASNIVT